MATPSSSKLDDEFTFVTLVAYKIKRQIEELDPHVQQILRPQTRISERPNDIRSRKKSFIVEIVCTDGTLITPAIICTITLDRLEDTGIEATFSAYANNRDAVPQFHGTATDDGLGHITVHTKLGPEPE